jgi:Cu+-exporting ATPase
MALEPLLATAESGPNPELADMSRRFWVGLVLSVPVLLLEMGGHLTGLNHLIPRSISNWLQFALATPVVLWAGWPFFERGYASVRTLNLNMFTLIAMGTGVAWVYSVLATAAPQLFPSAFRGSDGSVAVYFEAARSKNNRAARHALPGAPSCAGPRSSRRLDPLCRLAPV